MSSTRMTKIPPFKVTNTKFSFLETLKRYTIFIIVINSYTGNIYLFTIDFFRIRFDS